MNSISESIEEYSSKFFPVTKSLLGDWVREEIASDGNKHPLLIYLRKGEPDWEKINSIKTIDDISTPIIVDKLQRHHNHLINLENHLCLLSDKPRLGKFLEHLKQPNSFWQGYSEIETAALYLKYFGEIELEPHLSNCRNVEFAFPFDGKIYVEVNTPKEGQKFGDILNKVDPAKPFYWPDTRNRVKDVILREFEHFAGANIPGIIICNLNMCEFDGGDIAERLEGTSYAIIYVNRKNGSSFLEKKTKNNSIFINDPDLVNLGGIICYMRDFNIEGQVVYYSIDSIGIAFEATKIEKISQAFY